MHQRTFNDSTSTVSSGSFLRHLSQLRFLTWPPCNRLIGKEKIAG